MKKTGCIIQARMTSTRLPGKVMKVLDYKTGATILDNIFAHLKRAISIDQIILAITVNSDDDVLEQYCLDNDIACYRGSEDDVLDRYYQAAKAYDLDVVIRVTSDCPFVDAGVLEDLISAFNSGHYDYVSNGQTRTYPHGMDCEIFLFDVLEAIHEKTNEKFYREHVTSYIYTHPKEFKLGELVLRDQDYSDIRITVDTPKDYAACCVVKSELGDNDDFESIVKLFQNKPYIRLINNDIIQKKRYDSVQGELEDAVKMLDLQELEHAAEILRKEISG